MANPYFTLFTSVYNGEKHINRVFESVNAQIFNDFEWIIINDGSIDNTSILIQSFIQNHPGIDIIYVDQNHCGKHIAWNKAVELARGQLFIPADADDYFMPETLSFFYESWTALTPSERLSLSGINVLCLDNDTQKIVGNPYPFDGMKTNNLELLYKYKIKGEKWGCIRVDLLKGRSFPIIKGYFPESYLWMDLSKSYQVICFNKALRRYYTTDTGIIQTLLKNKYNPVQARVTIKYNFWFIKNFGFYLLVHSPKELYRRIISTMKLTLLLLITRFKHRQ